MEQSEKCWAVWKGGTLIKLKQSNRKQVGPKSVLVKGFPFKRNKERMGKRKF